ncbi:MAG: protease complex subunit PrcB family protein [Lachnospiraceae bacterium]|nr:protease complex subunit PrcB family protein [Lachnospiraceae bacterium]
MQKKRIVVIVATIVIAIMLVLTGCDMLSMERVKLRDLEFVILSEEVLSEELKAIIEERKTEPFKLTYADADALYICVGYGKQESGGYSITVDELYLTDTAIYVETTLLGPDESKSSNKVPSYPYIVIRTEALEQNVICE